jgi:hypothetical protein
MRVMVCVQADRNTEAGQMPAQAGLLRMKKMNDEPHRTRGSSGCTWLARRVDL